MKQLKLIFLPLLASSSLLASEVSLEQVGLNIGASHSSYSKKDHSGSIVLGNEPAESFNSFEVFTTLKPLTSMCKEKNMKPYISYAYSKNDDLKHQYLLAGINKYYMLKEYSFYSGALLGYGELDWKYDPLNTSKSKNIDANSFIIGVQGGFDYLVKTNITVGVNVKYLLHDYKTKLNPSDGVSSTIEHKSTSSISLGIKYSF